MFNPDSWQSHAEYRILFSNLKARFPSELRSELWDKYSPERDKLMALDLDPVGDFLSQFYSPGGRPAKNQAQILRSLILFALLFNRSDARLSLTSWVTSVLPSSLVLTALIGCSCVADLPPLGSYYDFMNRLSGRDDARYSRSALLPAGKNGRKPKKVIGLDGKLIEPEPDSFHTRDLADRIFTGSKLSDGLQDTLQDVFYLAAVLPSWEKHIIPHDNLTLSGDGTAVETHASPFGSRQKSCSFNNCPFLRSCPRHYSDPDAEWGWDSHEKRWFFGRTLYMLCCRNAQYKVELPLILNFTSAKRHDSINFFYAIDAFGRHMPGIQPLNLCMDSAHDNIPTYELLERWDINALIDINSRNSPASPLPPGITLDKQGCPHCLAGFKMCSWGFDKHKGHKYRCPLACGKAASCPCKEQCSDSSYGRTVYIQKSNDLRFFPRIPRDSEHYKAIYSERTACERVNNRVLNDYHLLDLKIRGDDHYAFWAMVIGICIHLDAWEKVSALHE